ncbi:hypothetical protein CLU79DRAFT_771086 [Phycomyces nitens]|nr:hypothetical protein CLU79DRAFT_771086 [Phycomyces nitens]
MAGAKMPIPCRFYPYCTNPVCPFMHPAPAPPAPSQRIPVPCNNGADCKRPDCHFTHPNDSTPETICKYDGVCTRPKCFYKHTIKTPVKPVHANMTLRANNDTPTNQRQFSVSEVTERIVLGESADLIKPPRPEDHDMDKDVVMDA